MKKRIPVINGLRGIAIIGVIYHHIFYQITGPGWHSFTIGRFTMHPFAPLSNGMHGVMLFFVLSGFVLSLPYAEKRRRMETFNDVRMFYSRRLWRLLPLLSGAVVASVVMAGYPDVITSLAKFGDTMMKTLWPFPVTEPWFYPKDTWVLWSLRVEIWFSLLFPALVWVMHRYGITLTTLLVVAMNTAGRQAFWPDWTPGTMFFFDSFLMRLDAFVLGMAVAWIFTRKPATLRKPWIMPCGIVFVLAGFWLANEDILAGLSILYMPRMLLIATGFMFITGSALVRRSVLTRVLELSALQILGVMCYSLYVWHGILLLHINPRTDVHSAAVYAIALLFFSLLSYLTLEGGSFGRLVATLSVRQVPTRVTASSTMPELRKRAHVSAPPSTRIEEIPWNPSVGVVSAFQSEPQSKPSLVDAT